MPIEGLRPPRPATAFLMPIRVVPGAPFPTAVANPGLKPSKAMRPPRPAKVGLMPRRPLPGALILRLRSPIG